MCLTMIDSLDLVCLKALINCVPLKKRTAHRPDERASTPMIGTPQPSILFKKAHAI